MKKILALALAACMVLTTACGAQTANSASADNSVSSAASQAASSAIVTAPTKLTFIFADGDENYKSEMNRVVDAFNAAYPDITIEIQPGDGGSYSEFLKTKDSVGEFPDMMEMRDAAQYVRAGKIAPLSDEIVSLFNTTVQFEGVTYTAPFSGANTMGIMYNKKYFTENGLAVPKTYDEFISLCKAIKDKGDMAPLVVGGSDIWHLGFLYDVCYANNVLVSDADFIEHCYQGSKNMSDDAMKGTMTDLAELLSYAQEGWASTPDAQITTFFVNDMAAMMFSGTHMFKQIQDADPNFEYGWFAIPSRDGTYNLYGGGTAQGWALSAESAKDANKKAAFEAFCRFFFAKDNYKIYCETMAALPTTADVPNLDVSEQFQAVLDAVIGAQKLHLMWNNEIGSKELPPDFRNFTYKTCIEVAQGTRTIDSACAELQKTWDVASQSFNPVTGVGIQ